MSVACEKIDFFNLEMMAIVSWNQMVPMLVALQISWIRVHISFGLLLDLLHERIDFSSKENILLVALETLEILILNDILRIVDFLSKLIESCLLFI